MRCLRCNTEWPDELAGKLKFCGACGAPMESQPVAPPTPSYAPGGEVRYVNVVFADLAGFTAFAEDRPPDEVARIVGDLLQSLGRVVEEHEGAIDKFLGDAVVAIFGWPKPDPNAARNAIRAGLAMQQAAVKFNHERNFNFELRVGVHAGEAMFRVMGGNWTVMGDTVNTASRIQSAATPGRVWISRAVYDEVRRFFLLATQPAIELKGKKQAVQPYEVIQERHVPLVDMPRFVGREKEWEQLQNCLDKAIQGNSLQVVLLRGVAGVGKSRLVWELRDWIQRQSAIFRVDLVQYDHSARLSSHGLNTLIRNRFNLPLELDDDTILEKLRTGVVEERTAVEPGREILAVEFFAFLMGILHPDFHIYDMDGKNKWEGAYVELKAWLEKHASQEPWIWFLEDAQKGDMDTANFVEWALHTNWHSPVLIVITVREEDYTPTTYWYAPLKRWAQNGQITEIRLHEIPPDVLAPALSTMLEGAVPEALAQRIAEHTEGNPLFATELVLFLHERGLLDAQATWRHADLPGSIREVMEARIERLGTEGKEVAKRGALMGRRFTRDAIERIWENPEQELENGFTLLRESEAIYEETSRFFAGEMESVFRHSRLHEAVLARIPREERLYWLKGLEKWARNKFQEIDENWERAGVLLVPLIARSLEENGDLWQASLWYEVLGLLHYKHHRSFDAIQAFQQALPHATGVRKLVLAWQIAEIEAYSGEGEKALQTLEEALAGGEQNDLPGSAIPPEIARRLEGLISDPLSRWHVLAPEEARTLLLLARGNVYTHLARVEEARRAYQETEACLLKLPDRLTTRRLWLRWTRAWAYFLSELNGDLAGAEKVFQQLRQRVELSDLELDSDRLIILSAESTIATNQGHSQEALKIDAERLRLAQAMNNRREEAVVWNSQGIAAHSMGDLAMASQCYEHAVEMGRSIGFRRIEVIALYNLGLCCLDQANLEKATRCIEEYLAISRLTGNHLAECYGPYTQGNIALEWGDFEQAEKLFENTLLLAQERGWPRLVEQGYLSRAQLLFHRGLVRNDPQELAAAAALFQQLSETTETLESESYACWALSLNKTGKTQEALGVIQAARLKLDIGNPQGEQWLKLAEDYISRKDPQAALDWFEQHGFHRVKNLVDRL
jgi:class 3 adenylate cyclase/tetratricopeptide (TPR) repeat protein